MRTTWQGTIGSLRWVTVLPLAQYSRLATVHGRSRHPLHRAEYHPVVRALFSAARANSAVKEGRPAHRVPVLSDSLEADRLADVHQIQDVLLEAGPAEACGTLATVYLPKS